jgi:microcin C transport system substrate-binding protein
MKTSLNLKSFLILLISGLFTLAITGCGGGSEDDGETAEAKDITPEKEAYYASFKRVPPELKAKLAMGEINQEEYNRAMEEVGLFYQFKTIEDLPTGLLWENGDHLPEIGSPDAIKGGTSYGALQDFPRTLRRVGPDANGGFRSTHRALPDSGDSRRAAVDEYLFGRLRRIRSGRD